MTTQAASLASAHALAGLVIGLGLTWDASRPGEGQTRSLPRTPGGDLRAIFCLRFVFVVDLFLRVGSRRACVKWVGADAALTRAVATSDGDHEPCQLARHPVLQVARSHTPPSTCATLCSTLPTLGSTANTLASTLALPDPLVLTLGRADPRRYASAFDRAQPRPEPRT
eukprot:3630093-Rhodomonas_salina.2